MHQAWLSLCFDCWELTATPVSEPLSQEPTSSSVEPRVRVWSFAKASFYAVISSFTPNVFLYFFDLHCRV